MDSTASAPTEMDLHTELEPLRENVSGNHEIYAECPSCQGKGVLFCERCHLVKYCGTSCQKAHFSMHKRDCKKAVLEYEKLYADYLLLERPPENLDRFTCWDEAYSYKNIDIKAYYQNLFWTPWVSKPPRDILRLAENEGLDYQNDLWLCLTSGDLGSVMTTINTLPSSYGGQCTVSINEYTTDSVLRIILMLGLALLDGSGHGNTVETITHFWYSASLTEDIHTHVMSVTSKILDAFRSADPMGKENGHYTTVEFSIPQAKSKLYMTLQNQEIVILQKFLEPVQPEDLAKSAFKEWMNSESRPLYNHFKDMWLAQIPPAYRVLDKQYRETGVLLPYGTNAEKFTKHNPSFGCMYTVAPTCGHLARPTDSADLPKLVDFAKRHNLPKNDVNGALYHATMDMVEAFCKKIVVHKVHFHVSSYSVGALPRKLLGDLCIDWGFDRIHIVMEPGSSQPHGGLLADYHELLKIRTENPHAKLSVLVSNEPDCALIELGGTSFRREAQDLLPWRKACFDGRSKEELMFARFEAVAAMMEEAKAMWRAKINRYGWTDPLGELSRTFIMSDPTDEEEWPYKLREMDFTEEEFVLRMSGSAKGNERFVMWQHPA